MPSSGKDKASMLRLGYFSEPGYNTIGDSYKTKQASADSRYKGQQILGGTNRRPKYFSKPARLFENDLYRTWDEIQREWRNQKSKKSISDRAFKPSNPTKKQSGTGDLYGSFTASKRDAGPPLPPAAPRQKVKHEIRNIVTNPPKKGSYGTIGTVLGYSSRPREKKVEFPYMPDPYDAAHQKRLEYIKAHRKAQEGDSRPPFRPASLPKVGGPGYSSRGFSKIEYISAPVTEKKIVHKKGEAEPTRDPFKPSHPPKSGFRGTLNKFPQHMADPFDAPEMSRKQDREVEKAAMKKMGDRPAFAAASFPKSVRTPSVFRMNIKVPSRA